jgi:ribosomal protein L28
MSVECEHCGRGPHTGDAVYRANEKGVTGRWRCKLHLNETARKTHDSATGDIVRLIEKDRKP